MRSHQQLVPSLFHSEPGIYIARHGDLDICFEGARYGSFRISQMLDSPRFADVMGANAKLFMSKVGWRHCGAPLCFTASTTSGAVAAAAWCGAIRSTDGAIGANLSYAVDEQHAGQGLGKILSAIAYLALHQTVRQIQYVNIQCQAPNRAAIGIALALGMTSAEKANFSIEDPGNASQLQYLGFRAAPASVNAAAKEILQANRLDELLALIESRETSESRTPENNEHPEAARLNSF